MQIFAIYYISVSLNKWRDFELATLKWATCIDWIRIWIHSDSKRSSIHECHLYCSLLNHSKSSNAACDSFWTVSLLYTHILSTHSPVHTAHSIHIKWATSGNTIHTAENWAVRTLLHIHKHARILEIAISHLPLHEAGQRQLTKTEYTNIQ